MQNLSDMIKLTDKEKKVLKDSFEEKLKDKNFKELVSLIKLDKEKLYDYTSSLEEASIEFGNCKNCKCLEECKNKVKGFMYKPVVANDTLNFNYTACTYQQKYQEQTKYKENVYLFEIPKKVKEASLKDLYKNDKKRIEFIKYVSKFIDDFSNNKECKGIYLYGSYGTGKTYLIAALFNELAKKDIKSTIVYVPEFLRVLKATFNSDNEDFEDVYESVKKAPLLLLDDMGAEYLTPWARDEVLGTILQYRMDEGLPTFFTSNLDLKQLESHFANTSSGKEEIKARRMIERIKELTIPFELVGESNRKNK